jgi:hypothetical protein
MKRRNRRAGRVRAERRSSRYYIEGRRQERGLAGGSHMAAPLADSELVDPRALAPTDHMRERARTGAAVATEPAS